MGSIGVKLKAVISQVNQEVRLINNSYKLLVVDIDGTLLGKNGTISAEDKKALARAHNSGIRVSLSTGRVVRACLNLISQLPLDGYHIFFDGALVASPEKGEEVYVKPISEESVKQIIEFAHRHEVNLDLYSATKFFAERETWATNIRRQFFDLEPTVVDFSELWRKERIIKGTLVVRSQEERAKADNFYRHFDSRLAFSWTKTPAYPEVDFINVLAPDVSKGKALEALASYLGVDLTEIMAIGDGINDVSLLSIVGLAVAMNNARPELKAVADYVTLDVDHNGVAAAINKLLG
ncbi:MAG: HAD family phosphatase [Chloroflexi bacterium]|nr:HAD family phosphatase [Chloroflexota bacterium]